MVQKTINFDDKKVNKIDFYKNMMTLILKKY